MNAIGSWRVWCLVLPRRKSDEGWRVRMEAGLRAAFSVALILYAGAPFRLRAAADEFSSEKAGFSIKFKGELSPYKVMSAFVTPADSLLIEAMAPEKRLYVLEASAGRTRALGSNSWRWHAPGSPGLYPLTVKDSGSSDAIRLNVFVMIPYRQLNSEFLNGYHIGKYPSIPLKQLTIYKPPRGFIEVTKENEETLLSPHFRLGQFLCKQGGGYPKYILLRERLLLKLELILEKVNEKGYRCDTFHIMSGYRTPYYNHLIGNVRYSRHVWGGAADIFIDVNPRDGMMDDLNRDGVIDYRDAAVLYKIVDDLFGRPWYEPFVGGLGRYKKSSNHGPFVHVDVRGFRARWGS